MKSYDYHKLIFVFSTVLTASLVIIVFGYIFSLGSPIILKEGIQFFTGSEFNYETSSFGIFYFIVGTLLLTIITLVLAVPISLMTALFLSEMVNPRVEHVIMPLIELLVGIPSVVYGLIGIFILEDFFQHYVDPALGNTLGLFIPFFTDSNPTSGTGMLLAATILAIMVLPTIIAISFDSFHAVPFEYREASFAIGATKWETITKVVFPASLSGVVTAVILGLMRAMGETMAVVMVMGNVMQIPESINDYGYAMTSKIFNDIMYHLDDPEPRAALFAIGSSLFILEFLCVAVMRFFNKRLAKKLKGENL